MPVSQFIELPDWDKKLLFKQERDRVVRISDLIKALADDKKLSPEAYATLSEALHG